MIRFNEKRELKRMVKRLFTRKNDMDIALLAANILINPNVLAHKSLIKTLYDEKIKGGVI